MTLCTMLIPHGMVRYRLSVAEANPNRGDWGAVATGRFGDIVNVGVKKFAVQPIGGMNSFDVALSPP